MTVQNPKQRMLLLWVILCIFLFPALAGCSRTQENPTVGETAETLLEISEEVCARYEGYTLIRPEFAEEAELNAAIDLRNLMQEHGCTLSLSDDFIARGEELPADAKEILVGRTNRQESVTRCADLRYDEFIVAREDSRIVIAGGSPGATQAACSWFAEHVLCYEGEGFSSEGDSYCFRKAYRFETASIDGVPLSQFAIRWEEDSHGEPGSAALLQKQLWEDTGFLLSAEKMSYRDSADEGHFILFGTDPNLEGYRITCEAGNLVLCGRDKTQLRAGASDLVAWIAASDTFTVDTALCLEGKMETKQVTLYLAPEGSGQGNGSRENPYVSVKELLAGMKACASDAPCDFTVFMKAGDYPIDETIVLDDSFGVYDAAMRFVCGEEAPARICAWTPVTGFTETTVNGVRAWEAPLPTVRGEILYPQQCFSHTGERLSRPRYPESGYLTAQVPGYANPADAELFERMDVLTYTDNAIEKFTRLEDVQMRMFHYWVDERLAVSERNTEDKTLTFAGKSNISFKEYTEGAPYFFDNVYEALGQPGEFYADRETGKLYYIPRGEDSIEGFTIYASDIETMLKIDGMHGTDAHPVLSFENVAFVGSDWKATTRTSGQAASDIGGAVKINDASHILFRDCRFEHIGNYAVEVMQAVSHLTMDHCVLQDLGAGGVTIFGANTKKDDPAAMHNIDITDCYIGQYGRVHTAGIGVVLRYAYDCEISHNEICDGFYSGISVGWIWGYADHLTQNILVEKNHIYQIGQGMLSDMGCIYTLGQQPGTVLRGNLVHGVQSRTSKGWGLYTDEGSSDILIENNISYDVCSEAFHQHYGRENIVQNNILALGRDGIVMSSRKEEHAAFILKHNILLSDGAPIYGQSPDKMNIRDDSNLVWNLAGEVTNAGGYSPRQMQERGLYQNALIADPGFADPQNGDFTLPADSPAWDIGFQPFDMSDVGIRPR